MSTLDCPVDFIPVNENRVRLTALWVLGLVLLSVFLPEIALPVFVLLSVDFFLRAFRLGKYSPLNILSGFVIKQWRIPNKPIDQAPKRFAAGIGFVLSVILTVLLCFSFIKAVLVLSLVFAMFAFLESFVRFCAGCYVYAFLKKAGIIR